MRKGGLLLAAGAAAVLVLAAAAVLVVRFLHEAGGRPPPSIVLVSVDTLRADHLGCYGNRRFGRSPSPAADALAAEGVLFEKFSAPRGQTHPSIASMLFGKYPITHGLRENGRKPRPGQVSFAELLREEGYDTAGFAANLRAYTLREPHRPAWWTAGFTTFGDGFGGDPPGEIAAPLQNQWLWDERVESRAREWIQERAREAREEGGKKKKPFFLWVHFFDVHKPYLPNAACPDFMPRYEGPLRIPVRPGSSGAAAGGVRDTVTPAIDAATLSGKGLPPGDHEYVLACYDAGVAGVDARIGRLLEALDRAGLAKDTWIFLTADHGEELGDHNNYYYHGASIYDSVLRIPLVVRPPAAERAGRAGVRTRALAQNVDLAPTFLSLAGIPPPPGMEGFSLLPVIEGRAASTDRTLAFAEWQDLIYSASDGRTKYIANPRGACPVKPPWSGGGGAAAEGKTRAFVYAFEELYDLERDPLEQNNLIGDRKSAAASLRAKLESWLGLPAHKRPFDAGSPLPPEEKKILEAMGYTAPDARRRDVLFLK